MLTLYDYELSGNCYKIRLMLGFLGIQYQTRHVDFHPGHEHKADWFLELNPLGQLPVLDDDGLILRDANAILTYLASRYDPTGQWGYGTDPARNGLIAQWLGFAADLTGSIGSARLHDAFGFPLDAEAARTNGKHQPFTTVRRNKHHHTYLSTNRPASTQPPKPPPTTTTNLP